MKLSKTEVDAILVNEAQQCYRENILTQDETVEYLEVVRAEIMSCWNTLTAQIYWGRECGHSNTRT